MIAFSTLLQELAAVLQDDYQETLEGYINETNFGKRTTGCIEHRFEECFVEHIKTDGDVESLVAHLGKRTTGQLLARLTQDIDPGPLRRPQLAMELSAQLGIPDLTVKGRQYYVARSTELVNEFGPEGKDVTAAARGLAERVLKEIALVALSAAAAPLVLESLTADEKIRLKPSIKRDALNAEKLRELMSTDSFGDLGMLTILLGRASKKIRVQQTAKGNASDLIELLTREEQAAFDSLAKALQSYAHFKPGEQDTRRQNLQQALENLRDAIRSMATRRAIPNAAIFLEVSNGIFGQHYIGRDENGREVRLRCDDSIPLKQRVMFREVSNPVFRIDGWTCSPW